MSKNGIVLTVLLLIFLATRLLCLFFPFWGLEYEDSFIYADASRSIFDTLDYSEFTYKTQSCLDGSLVNCFESGSYGGHLLTYPFFLGVVHFFIKYSPFNVFIFNLVVSLFIIIVLYRAAKNWSLKYNLEWNTFTIAILFLPFIVTPFIPLFHTSGLSETFSSLFVFCFFVSFLNIDFNRFNFLSLQLWSTLLLLIIAILVKRENLILVVYMSTIPFVNFFSGIKLKLKSNYSFLMICATVFSIIFVYYIGIINVEENEAGDIDQSTFSIVYLLSNLSQYLNALFNFNYWGLTGMAFSLVLFLLVIRKLKTNTIGLNAVVLYFLYLIIYSSHYRSYYQVKYGITDPFETLRYSVNYFPLIPVILFSCNISKFFGGIDFNKNKRIALYSIFGLVGISPLIMSVYTRINFSIDERYSRTAPIELTLGYAKSSDVIITDIPIAFHCYVSKNQHVVDSYVLTNERLTEIIRKRKNADIYFLKEKSLSSVKDERLNLNFNTDLFKTKIDSVGRYILLKL